MDHGRFGPPGLIGGHDGAPNEIEVGQAGAATVPEHRSKGEGYRLLVFLTCVDHLVDQSRPSWPGRYELVYQLRDVEKLRELRVRAFVDGDPPEIESATDLFPPADWDERETYDLFGVRFKGHPELTRILMPDDWVGHPLRRDYPVGGEVVEFSEEHQRWQTPPDRA